ncbi:PaaI family thioesterase [Rhodococcus rhodnii]|nr:PaaI family thioesterase [Rhodococcus rhodnii]TXG89251.1 PaaI family thioesterase [Rhodococcus rhodnii]
MSSTWTLPDDLQAPTIVPEFPASGEPLPRHWSLCFGCGDDQPSGIQMTFVVGDGASVVGRFEVARRYQGGPGVIHGGILGTAFDEAQGMACRSVALAVVTAHLEIDFARPIPLDSTLEITAKVDGTVRRKVYTSAEARIVAGPGADPDVVVGTSRGLFLVIDQTHFEKVKSMVDAVPAAAGTAAEASSF